MKYGNLPISVRALGSLTTPTTAQLKPLSSQLPAQLLNRVANQPEARRNRFGEHDHGGRESDPGRCGKRKCRTVPVTVEIKAPMAEFTGHAVDGLASPDQNFA